MENNKKMKREEKIDAIEQQVIQISVVLNKEITLIKKVLNQECLILICKLTSLKLKFKVKFRKVVMGLFIKEFGDRLLLPLKCSKFNLKVLLKTSLVNAQQWKF